MSKTTIEYKGVVTTVEAGKSAVIRCEGDKMEDEVVVTAGGESSGLDINGVIREYQVNAGASVSTGDFVEFVNKFSANEFSSATVSFMSASKLDNNRVFITYKEGSVGKALVLTIEGTKVSVGTSMTVISSSQFVEICSTTLSSNTAIIAYGMDSNARYGAVVPVVIDGSTITLGTVHKYYTSRNAYGFAMAGLSDNRAVLVCVNGDASVPKRMAYLFDTDGYTATTLSSVQLASGSNSMGSYYSMEVLSESKVFVSYTSGQTYWYRVLTIDGTSISTSSNISLGTIPDGFGIQYPSITALTENKVFVSHRAYIEADARFCQTCSIYSVEGTTATRIGYQILSDVQPYIYVKALTSNKVLALYVNNLSLKCRVITIGEESITAGEETALLDFDSSSAFSTAYILPSSKSSVLVIYSGAASAYLSLSIDGDNVTRDELIGTFVQPATSNLHNVGVAKTAGAEGETVEVYCAV